MLFGWILFVSPPFSSARARFWKRDYWPEFFGFAPRRWCDDSYGAAHRRFYSDQKYLKKQLYFNNFRLQHIVGNITCILVAGFSFIFDMMRFFINLRRSIFLCFLHVQIMTCFAQLFWLFCFDMCVSMLTSDWFLVSSRAPKCSFKALLCRKWQCA